MSGELPSREFSSGRTAPESGDLPRGRHLPPSGKPLPFRLPACRLGRVLAVLARLLLTPLAQSIAPGSSGQYREAQMSEGLFGIHGAALEIRSQRMSVLGSNIANAATPGYKARDVDFGSALQARLGGVEAERASEGAVKYRIPTMASLDGNTVEMATEQTAFAENAVAYTATLNFLRGRVETVTRAIRGE